jgi:hypothetical protein
MYFIVQVRRFGMKQRGLAVCACFGSQQGGYAFATPANRSDPQWIC